MTEAKADSQQEIPAENETAASPQAEAAAGEAAPLDDSAAQKKIAELETVVADLRDRLLRAVAETENTRKRLEKERQDTAKFAVASFARDLLTVADNLGRALAAVPEEQRAGNAIYEGVAATERELLRVFEGAGIKRIEALDKPFDPNFHEVLFETDVTDKAPGTIVQVVATGYTIHDRLLRPARVGVAKGGSATSGSVDTQA